jgi:type IX secretion system PorP/SprF family membrane protein
MIKNKKLLAFIKTQNKNFRLLIFIPVFLFSFSLKAQYEPMYSQYMFNLVTINPAYTGNRAVDNITLMYRNQWTGIQGAPNTRILSWDRRHEESNVGYGLQIYSDRLGVENSLGAQGFYSYRISFYDSFLSFGLSAGALNYRSAFSEVVTTQPGDPLFQEDLKVFMPTVGIGFLYGSEKWYVGFSAPTLLNTRISVSNQAITSRSTNHLFLTAGKVFEMNEVLKLKPSILLKAISGAPLQYDLNLNAWFNDAIGIGLSYRTNDAIVGMFELQANQNFRIGYAYDYTISPLNSYNSGTHELMLRYEFNKRTGSRILSPRYY